MIEFITNDESLTVKEIDKFIELNDTHGAFKTRYKWHDNFEKHFEKLISVKQIVTFRQDKQLIGLCSWMLVDKEQEIEINKTTWAMPDNVVDGNIIYIDICILRKPANIFKIKEFLDKKYRSRVNEVFWTNIPGSRFFRLKFKGGA